MKKVLGTLLLSFSLFLTINLFSNNNRLNQQNRIKDGWYEAAVKYQNSPTGTSSTYTLNVKVEYSSIVEIDFGKGGSIHSGYNNEGYFYSGGDLYLEKDYEGNIVAATATVNISDSNGFKYFKVRIE